MLLLPARAGDRACRRAGERATALCRAITGYANSVSQRRRGCRYAAAAAMLALMPRCFAYTCRCRFLLRCYAIAISISTPERYAIDVAFMFSASPCLITIFASPCRHCYFRYC